MRGCKVGCQDSPSFTWLLSHPQDTESVRIVQDALNRLIVGRTTVVVAHRLSTIKVRWEVWGVEGWILKVSMQKC